MSPILPNKTEFIPQAPANEHEIFMAMRTYPDNVKVYHPHGRIDATSVFWHNKLHPTTQNFAVYVDPKATEQTVLFPRILGDIEKLAWKFSNNQMITRDYVPQHPFNQWLQTKRFRLVDTVLTAELATDQLNLKQTVQLNKIAFYPLANSWLSQLYLNAFLNKASTTIEDSSATTLRLPFL